MIIDGKYTLLDKVNDMISLDSLLLRNEISIPLYKTRCFLLAKLISNFKEIEITPTYASKYKSNGSAMLVNSHNLIVGRKYVTGYPRKNGKINYTYKWSIKAFNREWLMNLLNEVEYETTK